MKGGNKINKKGMIGGGACCLIDVWGAMQGIGTSWKKPQGFKQDRQHRVDGTSVQRSDDGGGGSQPLPWGKFCIVSTEILG